MQSALPANPAAYTAEARLRQRRQGRERLTVLLCLLPALTLFVLFVIYPILQSVYYSLFNWNGLGPAVDYRGLKNYVDILGDKVFLTALRNGGLIIFFSLVLQLPFSLALAVLVSRNLPGRAFFRAVFFLPYVLSEVITAIMWLFLFNPDPDRGFLNALVVLIPGQKAIPWLGNTETVVPAIFAALTWKYFGFHLLLYLTGLQNIPTSLEEAARIDGANGLQTFFFVSLPLLASTIRTSIYLSVLGSIQQFILVWIMTKGGPVNASETLSTYMYRFGFVRFQLGYGSAVSIYIFLISLMFSLVYLRLTRQPDYLTGLEG